MVVFQIRASGEWSATLPLMALGNVGLVHQATVVMELSAKI